MFSKDCYHLIVKKFLIGFQNSWGMKKKSNEYLDLDEQKVDQIHNYKVIILFGWFLIKWVGLWIEFNWKILLNNVFIYFYKEKHGIFFKE